MVLLAGRLEVRGSCAYTIRLAEQLPRQGVVAQIVCQVAGDVMNVRNRQLPIVEYPNLDFPVWRHLVEREMLQLMRQNRPALIHVQTRSDLARGQRLAAALGVPLVVTMHDFLGPRETMRVIPERFQRVIAVSDPVKSSLVEQTGLGDEQVEVINSGVEVATEPAGEVLDIGNKVPVIGAAGPLERVKGHTYFLKAAKRILVRPIEAEFLIAGSGPEESRLRRLARDLHIAAHVTFVPYLQSFTEVLRAMDIFCLPSLQQGLGTTMLEAMALGKPVVATEVGGVKTVLKHHENGIVVPCENEVALAEGMLELLEDPPRARQLGQQARELVARQYNVERMAARTVRLYRELIAAAEAARPLPNTTPIA